MACNENTIKNMASEVARNCQFANVNVEISFVGFLIELLILNPKHGKQFTKTLNRVKLERFVNEVVAMIINAEPSLNTLKLQFVVFKNYDKLPNLLAKQHKYSEKVLAPLVDEIMEVDPEDEDEEAFKKLYRKICIYTLFASGLGNPTHIISLKEAMAALESVYQIEELYLWVTWNRAEKMEKLHQLNSLIAGIRLFNRECKLGGDLIPDLPQDLVEASKASLTTLCNVLITVMQRVNMLTSAIDGQLSIDKESGNVVINIPPDSELTEANYREVFEQLIFNRQYEVFLRKLIADMEIMERDSQQLQKEVRDVLTSLQAVCKFKSAVPVDVVFPLFTRLYEVWKDIQDTMYLVSTVTRLMAILSNIQEHMKIPYNIVKLMLVDKKVVNDEERMHSGSLGMVYGLGNTLRKAESLLTFAHIERHVQFLGFCTMCLCLGALVPCNLRLGMIKYQGRRYGFCSYNMANAFTKNPQRYINEVLSYAREHPQLINLLNMRSAVERVLDVDELVPKLEVKVKVDDKDIQTETHIKESYIDKNHITDLWEWKRRACKWATIVNCKTHSTQTVYSHMRSEHHCQTVQPRDKTFQTPKDKGIMTNMCTYYLWGLRGQKGAGQHSMDLVQPHLGEKMKPATVETCIWPCFGEPSKPLEESETQIDDDERNVFFYDDKEQY